MVARIAEHLAAGRDVFAYFKHEETPEGALFAVDLLRGAGRDVASYVSPMAVLLSAGIPFITSLQRPITRILHLFLIMASEANSRVLSGFLDYLRIEKGLAPLSISAYTHRHLSVFGISGETQALAARPRRRNDVRGFPSAAVFQSSRWAQRGTQTFGAASSLSLLAAR